MEPLNLSAQLLNVATLAYLFATAFYASYLAKKARWIFVAGAVVAGVAILSQTLALGIRWYVGGLYRPPWTNLYESLVYFSWGLAVIAFYADMKFRVRLVGLVVYPLVFAAMGLAYLTPQKSINPLVPALQSWWILAHACLAAFAYSGFIVASVFAFLYLIKERISRRALVISAALIGLCGVLFVGGKAAFFEGSYTMRQMQLVEGVYRPMLLPGTERQFSQVEILYAAPLFWVAAALYLAALLVSFSAWREGGWSLRLMAAGFVGNLGALGAIIFAVVAAPHVALNSNPYALVMLALFTLIVAVLLFLVLKPDTLPSWLPAADWLDDLAYKFTLFAFPFMTLILITGAIWAHEAWGRYWGWDPKETTALMTWLIYAGYLHSRMARGWRGKRAAVVSIIGFFSVIFTYLGTNLVLSGLHSYGAQ